VKGCLFIASPLRGDGRIDIRVKEDLGPLFQGVTPFIACNEMPDYLDHFWSNFEASNLGQGILDLLPET
jgi:hypothetical protein